MSEGKKALQTIDLEQLDLANGGDDHLGYVEFTYGAVAPIFYAGDQGEGTIYGNDFAPYTAITPGVDGVWTSTSIGSTNDQGGINYPVGGDYQWVPGSSWVISPEGQPFALGGGSC